jgi:hypothetical protein
MFAAELARGLILRIADVADATSITSASRALWPLTRIFLPKLPAPRRRMSKGINASNPLPNLTKFSILETPEMSLTGLVPCFARASIRAGHSHNNAGSYREWLETSFSVSGEPSTSPVSYISPPP